MSNYDSPRGWAKLNIYKALMDMRGVPNDEARSAVTWAIQRLHWDLTGDLMPPGTFTPERLDGVLEPDMGADLADMGEWAEWIIESFIPRG